jgi:hypothetical protein
MTTSPYGVKLDQPTEEFMQVCLNPSLQDMIRASNEFKITAFKNAVSKEALRQYRIGSYMELDPSDSIMANRRLLEMLLAKIPLLRSSNLSNTMDNILKFLRGYYDKFHEKFDVERLIVRRYDEVQSRKIESLEEKLSSIVDMLREKDPAEMRGRGHAQDLSRQQSQEFKISRVEEEDLGEK